MNCFLSKPVKATPGSRNQLIESSYSGLKEIADRKGLSLKKVGETDIGGRSYPIYKMIDQAKDDFDRNKKLNEQRFKDRKKARSSEIRINTNIGKNDLDTKLNRSLKDLSKGRISKVFIIVFKKHRGRRAFLPKEEYITFFDDTVRGYLEGTYTYSEKTNDREGKYVIEVWI